MLNRTDVAITLAVLLAAAPAWADGACRLPESKGSITASSGRGADRVDGSGRIADDKRSLAGFTSLRATGPFDIELRAATRESVTVRADDNLFELIETRVRPGDAALEIGLKPQSAIRTRQKPRIVVEFVKMDAVSLTGSGDLIADRIRSDAFAVAISGSNDVCIETLEAATLGLSIAGSGDFRAAGRADTQGVRIAGSGDADLRNLTGKVVKITIAGSGDVRVHATETLEVTIAGSGDVLYRGEPKITKSIAGSGDLRPLR
jgi:hypothetical protein